MKLYPTMGLSIFEQERASLDSSPYPLNTGILKPLTASNPIDTNGICLKIVI